MKSRRHFLRDSATMAAGALLLPRVLASMNKPGMHDVGIQLYSVRKEMLEDATGTLIRLGKIGYKEIESAKSEKGNYYGLKPKEIKTILKDHGMTLRSGHTHIDKDWQQSIDEAAEAGQEYIICATLPSAGQTVDHYKQSAEQFSKAGEDCKKKGILFGYHNHDAEFDTDNGQILYDVLLDNADPKLVHMELDLGWVIAAGKDPQYYFDKYPGRFPLWHLKDMSKTEKRSVEFGKGKVDVTGLLKQAKKSGLKYFFVEQEEYAVSAFDSMEYDYQYLMTHPVS